MSARQGGLSKGNLQGVALEVFWRGWFRLIAGLEYLRIEAADNYGEDTDGWKGSMEQIIVQGTGNVDGQSFEPIDSACGGENI